ncbi:MAG: UbiX family flavin prenyltransferase [Planctomycetes bacterium]|nr:UbiX family flavin prenyltransferase [Planctomycetota bacterium]
MSDAPGHWIIAVTGASGTRYGLRTIDVLRQSGMRLSLAVSNGGARVLEIEDGIRVDPESPTSVASLAPPGDAEVRGLALSDIAAGVCSGTHPVAGMIVIPCSMGTLGRIAAGVSSNVIERSADVMLKEGRPLVIVPREAPLSRVHLENMLRLHDAGAAIVPASPGFYHRPATIEDLVDQVVTKVLDRARIPSDLIRRWKSA